MQLVLLTSKPVIELSCRPDRQQVNMVIHAKLFPLSRYSRVMLTNSRISKVLQLLYLHTQRKPAVNHGVPRTTTDKLQRVMNGAARVLMKMRKFDRGMTHARRHDLHWLDVPDRVKYRLCVTVYKCLHGMAPQYLSDLCTPVAEVPGRQRLRSADCGQLQTPRYRLTTSGGRSFTCAAPSIWNALPDYLKDTALSLSYFEKQLKTFLFSRY